MSWYAIESVDDAIDATRSFLFPFDLGQWLRLGLIAIFVGVGGGGISSVFNLFNAGSTPSGTGPDSAPAPAPAEPTPEMLPVEPVVIAAIVAGLLLLGLAVSLLSEILRLVFYDGLRTDTVRIRGPAKRRFGQALRLFLFKLVLNVVSAIPIVLIGVAVFAGAAGELGETAMLVGGLLAVAVAAVTGLVYLIVARATTEFVTPIMVVTDSGVLDGWRRFWPVLRGNLAQFGVYVVVHFLVLLAISIGQSIIGFIIFGIVGIIGGIAALVVVLGVFGGFGAAVASTAGLVALGVIAAVTLLIVFVLTLPINIVVLTYVFSYELSVLGAADEELRLLPAADGGDPSTVAE
ncbi:DUF7544 domain-containing protein [Halohasta salina]|uniref:DUF7544 domain-containing protein n=1 Tax=Halohasta salina TaxID=2961621 RepID=UPI0020A448C5|nr:hypothetical protein [Halohasta salina]